MLESRRWLGFSRVALQTLFEAHFTNAEKESIVKYREGLSDR